GDGKRLSEGQKDDRMSSWAPIDEIAADVRSGKLSALELVNESLKRIDDADEYKSVIAKTTKRARERAEFIDGLVRGGKNPGRLAGVPFIAKDNFLAFGADT